ncbi:MAG TPA: hypothetical protein ENL19_03225 [candidate division WOR-3 bacterium]|uniref:Uncharacterized protein n=1 Tax=candidate division WOR-3 bacterium TaxID=2052148 RepID=A0A7C5DCC2_UNCW3|nr:hypothetical protein [candidate division WOR-3 bacterium]
MKKKPIVFLLIFISIILFSQGLEIPEVIVYGVKYIKIEPPMKPILPFVEKPVYMDVSDKILAPEGLKIPKEKEEVYNLEAKGEIKAGNTYKISGLFATNDAYIPQVIYGKSEKITSGQGKEIYLHYLINPVDRIIFSSDYIYLNNTKGQYAKAFIVFSQGNFILSPLLFYRYNQGRLFYNISTKFSKSGVSSQGSIMNGRLNVLRLSYNLERFSFGFGFAGWKPNLYPLFTFFTGIPYFEFFRSEITGGWLDENSSISYPSVSYLSPSHIYRIYGGDSRFSMGYVFYKNTGLNNASGIFSRLEFGRLCVMSTYFFKADSLVPEILADFYLNFKEWTVWSQAGYNKTRLFAVFNAEYYLNDFFAISLDMSMSTGNWGDIKKGFGIKTGLVLRYRQ